MSDELGSYERMSDAEKRDFMREVQHPPTDPRDKEIADLKLQLAQAQASLAAAREQALEEAENAFIEEYCKHDSPIVGASRGQKAIRALITSSTALAKLLAEERLEELRYTISMVGTQIKEIGWSNWWDRRVAELKGEQK